MSLLNGKFGNDQKMVYITDRGYQFGDGIYEVIRVYNGTCFKLDEHLARLFQSGEKIFLDMPHTIAEMKDKIIQLVEINKLKDGIVYIQITRGVATRTHSFLENISPVLVAYTEPLDRPVKKNERRN